MPEQSPPARALTRCAGVMSLFAIIAGGLAATASPALADVATAEYSIGTPSNGVADVVAAPATLAQGATTNFVVKFRATAALAGSGASTVTVTSSSPLATVPARVALIDDSDAACFEAGANAEVLSTATITLEVVAPCTINAGDEVEVDFTAGGPRATGILDFSVTTSANATAAASNSLTVGEAPPVLAASSVVLGENATYTLAGASWATLGNSATALVVTAQATAGPSISWYSGASGYFVTYMPKGGTPVNDAVTATHLSTSAAGSTVTLALAAPVSAGGSVTIAMKGTNPTSTSTDVVSVTPEAGAAGALSPTGTTETSTDSLAFGTLVTGVSVVPTPAVASAPATYVVSFEATTALAGGGGADICLSEPDSSTAFSSEKGALVSDTTSGWHFIANNIVVSAGSPPTNPGCDQTDNGAVIALPKGFNINAGDSVNITIVGITNPAAGTVADFSVATSADTVAVDAAPYVIGASGSTGVVVSVRPSTTGSLATYTISGLRATGPLAAGSSTVTLQAPPGTVFPDSPAFYTVQDATTPAGSGPVRAPLVGGGTNNVTIRVPAPVKTGDALAITAEDVINPSSASTTYSMNVIGPVTGPPSVVPFPAAGVTYPNGAIVNFSGTYFVFAGGSAFPVPSSPVLAALQKVDPAEVQTAPAGAAPPTGPPRPGTLLFTRAVNGTATIYVAGTDGELHGFATPQQFLDDGYDPALVVTVPSLGRLGVGAPAGSEGAAGDALSTRADGALVISSGSYYVLAGGRAFEIPSPATLAAVRKTDQAQALKGTVSGAQTSAAIADGELLSVSGTVYVSYQGDLYPFKSEAQLRASGYGGTAAIAVPATAGLPVVVAYTTP